MNCCQVVKLTSVLFFGLAVSHVDATTLMSDTTIGVNDSRYEGHDLVVTGCTLTINGTHAFSRLTLSNGAILTHSPAAPGAGDNKLNLSIAQELFVDSSSKIDVSFKGYNSTIPGPGAGVSGVRGSDWGSGGAYGGYGADAPAANAKGGQPYGSVTEPRDWGSAGGPCPSHGGVARAGGGAIHLVVGGTLTVNGQILANGDSDYEASNDQEVGGGAGGSIWLVAGTLNGSGTIAAMGGAGDTDADGGGGGGGRIALYYGTKTFNGTITARAAQCSYPGGAGTIYEKSSGQRFGAVVVDNGGLVGAATGVEDPESFSLTLVAGGKVAAKRPMTLWTLHVATNGILTAVGNGTNLTVTVLSDLQVDLSGSISVNGQGYPVGTKQGPGSAPEDYNYAGGAAYGGQGGLGYYGAPAGSGYGSVSQPIDLGSAGGTGAGEPGSAGGGAMRLVVGGTLTLNGTITANGISDTPGHGGCGSGGSVWITAGTIRGSGSILANGGSGRSNCDGGAGGGGRIAIYYSRPVAFDFAAQVLALGGGPFGCPNSLWGGAGTVYLKNSSQSVGDLVIQNGGHRGASTLLTLSEPVNLTVANQAVVELQEPGAVTDLHLGTNGILTAGSTLGLAVLGNAAIDAGGWLNLDGKGYPIGTFHGPGTAADSERYAGGGAYGGEGGLGYYGSPGGSAYGSLMQPTELGSAGGTGAGEPGSHGGGAVQLTVNGTLTLDGRITANGISDTPGHGGCGSGGSIWLTCDTLEGSGVLAANGGSSRSDCDGGAGGGGRIAVYYREASHFNLSSQVSARGGGPFNCPLSQWGGAGTIYLKAAAAAVGDLVIDNGGNMGSALTPVTSPEAFALTISGGAMVTASRALTINQLHVATNSSLLQTAGQTNLEILVLDNAQVDPGAFVNADQRGYPVGNNRGPGSAPDSDRYAGGGGYGGAGGTGFYGAPGGSTYGSVTQPVDLGSAGGAGAGETGSPGGGAIRFTVLGSLLLNGTISANGGGNNSGHGGCGAGGSIWLTADSVAGGGLISADGGTGRADCDGGGGGGGRIAVYAGSLAGFDVTRQVSAAGGGPFSCATFGQTGTVYVASTLPALTVLSAVPNDNQPRPFASYVELLFNQAIDPATFTADDVTILTPAGIIPPGQLQITNLAGARWRVAFPTQSADGAYQYTIGPHLANASGTEMLEGFTGVFVIHPSNWARQLSFATTSSTLLLAIPSLTGLNYQLLRSTDLVTWQNVGIATPGNGELLRWTFPPFNTPGSFFRLQISEVR